MEAKISTVSAGSFYIRAALVKKMSCGLVAILYADEGAQYHQVSGELLQVG